MLPIEAVLPQIIDCLSKQTRLIIQAPPGAGKSTALPLALLKQLNLTGKILLLEPRRVAAKNIANYLASQLGEKTGQTIGLRMRGQTQVSSSTRLEVVTEGVLTRILQNDPELTDYQLVLFDEFHERSLNADLGFVLTDQVQQALRDDLKLIIMSATLDLPMLKRILPETPIIESEGRQYPIDMHYRPQQIARGRQSGPNAFEQHLVQVIREALHHEGDILVFLAGVSEIKKAEQALLKANLGLLDIQPLHGRLSLFEQQKALQANPDSVRKIVLTTNIAETSLTIENIRIVIDSGFHKTVRFDPKNDFQQLITERISQASATQRAGRAGRVAPGICFRLWSEDVQERLRAQYPAEIEQADLTQVLYETRLWGETDIFALNWPTPPKVAQLGIAEEKLNRWQLLNENGQLNAKAQQLTRLSPDLKMGLLLNQAQDLPVAHLFSVYYFENQARSHWDLRQDLLKQVQQQSLVCKQAERALTRALSAEDVDLQFIHLLEILVHIWPKRLAKLKRHTQNSAVYTMASGSAVELKSDYGLNPPAYLWVMDAGFNAQQANGVVYSAAALTPSEFEQIAKPYIKQSRELDIHPGSGELKVIAQTQVFNLILEKSSYQKALSSRELQQAWLNQIKGRYSRLMSEPQLTQLQVLIARWQLASQFDSDFEAIELEQLIANAENWLSLYLSDIKSLSGFQQLDLARLWLEQQDYQLQNRLAELCPTRFQLEDGRESKIDYLAHAGPTIRGFMQSFYGLNQHPNIADGKQALVVELLSPARRAIQTTQDLINFWQGSYQLVQKEMKANYPKHYWPDDPANAEAGTATKKQRQYN